MAKKIDTQLMATIEALRNLQSIIRDTTPATIGCFTADMRYIAADQFLGMLEREAESAKPEPAPEANIGARFIELHEEIQGYAPVIDWKGPDGAAVRRLNAMFKGRPVLMDRVLRAFLEDTITIFSNGQSVEVGWRLQDLPTRVSQYQLQIARTPPAAQPDMPEANIGNTIKGMKY